MPAGATREDFAIGRDEMENINKIVRKLRDDGRDLSNQLRKREEDDGDQAEKMEINVASELYEAFLKYQERMPIPAEAIGEKSKRPSSEEKKRQQEMNFADEKTTTKKLCELSSADVAAVIETEKTEMLSHGAIASKHNISTALAGRIIRSSKKKKDFIRLRKQKEEDNEEKKAAVKQAIGDWEEDDDGLLTLNKLRIKLQWRNDMFISVTTLRKIMRNDLGLRFKKIKQLAPQTNKLKNVVCRQRYALTMLCALDGGMRVINVDESWLNSMAFKRHAWMKKGKGNARTVKELSTRVSFIAAIDNRGASYVSLGTANTDSGVMISFFFELAKTLDAEDPNWRANTVILLDNASYHRTQETRAAIKKLGIKTIYSGPYSYVSAPIEKFFGLLKRGDLNPERQQVGKR